MSPEIDQNEQLILNGLDEVLSGVTKPCALEEKCGEVCGKHDAVVALVKYLTAITKSLFKQQNEIKGLMLEIKKSNEFLVRTRKIIMWASIAIGGAFLAQWGEAIFLAVKTIVVGSPTP